MKEVVPLNQKNEYRLSGKEAIDFLTEDNRITIFFENGFKRNSDTADVFEGIYGSEKMEDSPFIDAFDGMEGVSHTFFLKNPIQKGFEAFAESELVKRIIQDGYWSHIHLDERPLIEGMYVTIINEKQGKME